MFNSIRVQLTLWYLLVFGILLIIFSTYIYSLVSSDMHNRFDAAILRTAQSMASYFAGFKDRNNAEAVEASETILILKEGRESAAIFREGKLLAATDDGIINAIDSTKVWDSLPPDHKSAIVTDTVSNKRLAIFPFQTEGVKYTIAVLEPLDKLDGQIRHLRNIILFGLPVIFLLATGGGFLLVRKSLASMVTISEQAEHISAKNLSERLMIKNPDDELGQLTAVFNALLSRLDKSFQIMREFIADASHELRTPLAIVHGEAEVSLSQNRTVNEYKQSLGVIRSQSKRMTLIVSDMLALARADAGEQQHLQMEELYLNDAVEECCRSARGLAALKNIQLNYEADEDVLFYGNEELLKRMLVNLIDNAIRYTPADGAVSVKLKCDQSFAQIIVSDTGYGIPPDSVERVFDRFYRVVDNTSVRRAGGSGLGLSIVRLAAELHQGSVVVSSRLGQGSTFTVTLPL